MIVAGAAEVAASIRILAFVIVNARTSLLCDALTLSFEENALKCHFLLQFVAVMVSFGLEGLWNPSL